MNICTMDWLKYLLCLIMQGLSAALRWTILYFTAVLLDSFWTVNFAFLYIQHYNFRIQHCCLVVSEHCWWVAKQHTKPSKWFFSLKSQTCRNSNGNSHNSCRPGTKKNISCAEKQHAGREWNLVCFKCYFTLHLGFHWRDFPESPCLPLITHASRVVEVWLRSVCN